MWRVPSGATANDGLAPWVSTADTFHTPEPTDDSVGEIAGEAVTASPGWSGMALAAEGVAVSAGLSVEARGLSSGSAAVWAPHATAKMAVSATATVMILAPLMLIGRAPSLLHSVSMGISRPRKNRRRSNRPVRVSRRFYSCRIGGRTGRHQAASPTFRRSRSGRR